MMQGGGGGGGKGGIPPAALEAMMAAAAGGPSKVTLKEVASEAKQKLWGYALAGLFLSAAPAILYIAAERRGSTVGELLKEMFTKLPYAIE